MSNISEWARQIRAAVAKAPPDDRVLHYLPLAYNLAMSMCKYEHETLFDDLVGVANLALVEAANKYPGSEAEKRGVPYPAYARGRIKFALYDFMRKRQSAVYVPEKVASKLRKVRGGKGDEELAAELNWPVEEVRRLRGLATALRNVVSLDTISRNTEDSSEPTTIGEETASEENVEEAAIRQVDIESERAWLTQSMDELPFSTRVALSLYFGIPRPSLETIPAERVLAVASYIDTASSYALKRLREMRRDEHGDLPDVVPSNRGSYLGVVKGVRSPQARERQRRGEEFWRRLCDSEEAPTTLEWDE